jgi:hypothetical protein
MLIPVVLLSGGCLRVLPFTCKCEPLANVCLYACVYRHGASSKSAASSIQASHIQAMSSIFCEGTTFNSG